MLNVLKLKITPVAASLIEIASGVCNQAYGMPIVFIGKQNNKFVFTMRGEHTAEYRGTGDTIDAAFESCVKTLENTRKP